MKKETTYEAPQLEWYQLGAQSVLAASPTGSIDDYDYEEYDIV